MAQTRFRTNRFLVFFFGRLAFRNRLFGIFGCHSESSSSGFQAPSASPPYHGIMRINANFIVAKFRSISTGFPKGTRNFVTVVNTSSEISLFLLAHVIKDLPQIWPPLRQRSPVPPLMARADYAAPPAMSTFRLYSLRQSPAPSALSRCWIRAATLTARRGLPHGPQNQSHESKRNGTTSAPSSGVATNHVVRPCSAPTRMHR